MAVSGIDLATTYCAAGIVGWILDHLQTSHPGYLATMTDGKKRALRLRLKSYAEEGKIKLFESQDANPAFTFQIPSVDIFAAKPIAFSETLTTAGGFFSTKSVPGEEPGIS